MADLQPDALARETLRYTYPDDFVAETRTAVVLRAKWANRTVAVKALKAGKDPKTFATLAQNTARWETLDHPYILKLYGTIPPPPPGDSSEVRLSQLQDANVFNLFGAARSPTGAIISPIADLPLMVMEFCPSLRSMIAIAAPRGGLTFNRAIIWAAQIALGMRHLHELSPPIVHGDLKTTNVLLTSDLTVKLSDINISAVKANAAAGRNTFTAGISADTIKFMAPERLEGSNPTIAGDVYSFAMTLYELFTAGSQPFSLNGLTTDSQVVTAVIIDRRRPTRPPDASLCPDAMWSLIQRCWDDEPGARPTFRTIVDMLAAMSEDVAALVAPPPEKVTPPEDAFKAPAAREIQLSPMRNKDRLTWESWHRLSMQPQTRPNIPRTASVSIAARAFMVIHFVLTLTLAVVLILILSGVTKTDPIGQIILALPLSSQSHTSLYIAFFILTLIFAALSLFSVLLHIPHRVAPRPSILATLLTLGAGFNTIILIVLAVGAGWTRRVKVGVLSTTAFVVILAFAAVWSVVAVAAGAAAWGAARQRGLRGGGGDASEEEGIDMGAPNDSAISLVKP